MSNITEEIEKLSGIMSKLGEAHNMLAKISLSKEEYQPISGLLAKAKVELFNFCNNHKAALQNKVSDPLPVIPDWIIKYDQKNYQSSAGKAIRFLIEYASIVNERKDNIPADFKQVTGHNSPKETVAYEKGREDEQEVIMKWIEQWDGSSNSAMGTLLKKKFDEKKDNVGVNDAIEFADWLNKNASRNAVGSWMYFGNMFYTKTSKELYDIFKSESQPQQKEV